MKTEQLLRWMRSIEDFIYNGSLKEMSVKWRELKPWQRPYPPFVMTQLFQSDEENPFISDNIYHDQYSGLNEIFSLYEKVVRPITHFKTDADAISLIEHRNIQSQLEEACRYIEKQLNILIDWLEGRESLKRTMSPPKAPSDFPEISE